MKKFFKIISFVLVFMMLAGVLSACSDKPEPVAAGGEYTYWVSMTSTSSQTLTSYNEMLMYQEMEKATGTKVTFIHPASGATGNEAFQIMLSSGDYPDMIEYRWDGYAGGAEQAIKDGVIIALNDYLEEYAPNYYDYMEGERGKANDYLYKAQSTTHSGSYYGFKNMNIGIYRMFSGLYVRKDMLDKWGVDIPETIDDWTNLFKVAKENGVKAPLTGVQSLFNITVSEIFNTAWNVGKGWYVDEGKVKYGPFEKNYKAYVKQMADWMAAGYIDPDYITNASSNVDGFMTNGSSVAAYGAVGGGIGKLLPAMADKDPNYNIVACPYPVLKEGDVAKIRTVQHESAEPSITISVQCGIDNEERYKEAIRWCDYLYSDEGMILKSFGVEGVTYTVEEKDGEKHYVYTDAIMDHEKIGAHSVEAALWHYFRPSNSPGLNQHPDYLNGFYPYQQQLDALETWNQNTEEAKSHMLPPLTYTDEEVVKKVNIEAKCLENLNAAISNIILGKASIDTYDKAINDAKEGGFSELHEIQQAAYDRYMANK